jgi:Tol biopolymer transport system component
LDGGTPVQLTNYNSSTPVVSPDGKTIACFFKDQPKLPVKLALVSIDGGAPTRTFDLPLNVLNLRWAPDGKAVTFATTYQSGFTISNQDLDGSKPKLLASNPDFQLYDFFWTPDGKQLIVSYGLHTDDVVLMRDFR